MEGNISVEEIGQKKNYDVSEATNKKMCDNNHLWWSSCPEAWPEWVWAPIPEMVWRAIDQLLES